AAAGGRGDAETRQLPVAAFLAEPVAIQRRLLEEALWGLGCRPGCRQIEALRALAAAPAGQRLHLAGGLRASRQGALLVLAFPYGRGAGRGEGPPSPAPGFRVLLPEPGEVPVPELAGRLAFRLLPATAVAAAGPAMRLAADDVAFPLEIRSLQPGDRFRPEGAPGSKKVARFLSDLRVPRAERWRVPVLLAGQRILALVGIRPDELCRIRPATATVLEIRWQGPPLPGPGR
ncbi:MAG: tRNA lysidine(34) synthetase TilS, partial [Thermodesulfobacteriota bacterium]